MMTQSIYFPVTEAVTQSPVMPSSFQKTFEFINKTTEDIWITDRNNLPIKIPKLDVVTFSPQESGFIIRESFIFVGLETIREIKAALEHRNLNLGVVSEERRIILEKLREVSKDHTTKIARVVLDRFIRMDQLRTTGMYHEKSTGFTVSFGGRHANISNQESREYEMDGGTRQLIQTHANGFLFEIIDNEGSLNERFIFSANSVVTITVAQDQGRPSGLYVTEVKDFKGTKSDTEVSFYPLHNSGKGPGFEEAEKKYGLYKTKEEAMTSGNPENISRFNLERLQGDLAEKDREHKLQMNDLEKIRREESLNHDRVIQEMELEKRRNQARQEAESKAREEEIARLKDELDRRKAERSDYYDQRSADRRDTSELVKVIPALMVGLIGGIVLFKK